jgi:hypothetical protein
MGRGKGSEDGVKAQAFSAPYRTLSIIHRDRRCKHNVVCIINDLPTCLRLTQSACVFNVSLAFHKSIADMYQVIDCFCGARLESVRITE